MAEIFISVVSKTAEYMVEPIISPIFRTLCFKNIAADFQRETENLKMRQDRVKNEVQEAKNNAKVIEQDVEKWLRDVEVVMEEIEQLQNDLVQNKSCFITCWCPNWLWRYQLSKKAVVKTAAIKKLLGDGIFGRVAHPATPPNIELIGRSDEFMASKSANSAFKQIVEELKKVDINMIGLYGMGGIGKTTLAKLVAKEAKEQKAFDHVVMVVLSQTPDIWGVQGKLADFLNLKFDQESEEGRAGQLHLRLKGKKVLIILDDVWKHFDLGSIGIPSFHDEFKGCKILVTTRRLQVCTSMQTQITIELGFFSEDEAWTLFKVNARIGDDFVLKDVARGIAGECKGLAVALVTVGRALRDKTSYKWIEALQQLKDARLESIPDVDDEINAYKCLRLSYDYLKQKETQFLLLLCSLFPEDYEIDVEDLTRCVYGLFQGVKSIEDARRKVSVEVNLLRDSCLLLGTDHKEFVKMHDVVRDVALWIGSTENGMFAIKDGTSLKDLTRNKDFESCRAISFLPNSTLELTSYEWVCPKLEILLLFDLKCGEGYVKLSNALFKNMKALKVLDLRTTNSSKEPYSLPLSSQSMTNLRTLNLRSCYIVDMSGVGELKKLEILTIRSSQICCQLDEIGALSELRLLDLSDSTGSRMLPFGTIYKLSRLEELYIIGGGFIKWEVEGTSSGRASASSSMDLEKATCFPDSFCRPILQWYNIKDPRGVNLWSERYATRILCLSRPEAWSRNVYYKKLLPSVQYLRLGLEGEPSKNMVPVLDQRGFIDMISLILYDGDEMVSLVDTTDDQSIPTIAFPNLVEATLSNMPCLRALCLGAPPKGFLQKLKKLSLSSCSGLCVLFLAQVLHSVRNLEELQVHGCHELELLFQLEGWFCTEGNENHVPQLFCCFKYLRLFSLPKLKNIWMGPTRFASLHNLTEVRVRNCPELTYIFSASLTQSLVQLKILRISECEGLKEIIRTDPEDEEISEMSTVDERSLSACLGKLKILQVEKCGKLKTIFPIALSRSLVQLEELEISENAELENVFGHDTEVESRGPEPDHDSLACFENLRILRVECCRKLKTIFPFSVARSALQLEELYLSENTVLEHVFGESDTNEVAVKPDHPHACFEKLRILKVEKCKKLKTVFPISIACGVPQLEKLFLSKNAELEHVFGTQENGKHILLPRRLRVLELDRLPNFISFYPAVEGNCFWTCSSLECLQVQKCPKMSMHFS